MASHKKATLSLARAGLWSLFFFGGSSLIVTKDTGGEYGLDVDFILDEGVYWNGFGKVQPVLSLPSPAVPINLHILKQAIVIGQRERISDVFQVHPGPPVIETSYTIPNSTMEVTPDFNKGPLFWKKLFSGFLPGTLLKGSEPFELTRELQSHEKTAKYFWKRTVEYVIQARLEHISDGDEVWSFTARFPLVTQRHQLAIIYGTDDICSDPGELFPNEEDGARVIQVIRPLLCK
ncbi:hypothetical protein DSO57_1005015 [Entomophthora muscae]|uniref:Uncharacterized protein n=1 Tax=Entomophthora muscae TaxID=34485 RepID=A0ACC2TIU3_9FUNG|nr:hypothetical protein DSO57_1005015 [Entomophthora muscae]